PPFISIEPFYAGEWVIIVRYRQALRDRIIVLMAGKPRKDAVIGEIFHNTSQAQSNVVITLPRG
ncbi:MAG: hypothetical protein JW719_14395, partial [Pirellulales bacterium]|nr:hypothetical protein [Pirellulales bacterium]